MGVTKKSRVFVAGGNGLIGSACCRVLMNHGFKNLLSPTREELDLSDKLAVQTFFKKASPEYVIMGAGRVGGIIENSSKGFEMMRDNLIIQENLISSSIDSGVCKVVYFGSSCMYPKNCQQPMSEEFVLSGKPEETSLPYAVAKLTGLYMCLSYNRQYGKTLFLPVIPNSAYGPFDDFDPKTSHVLSGLITRFHEAKSEGSREVILWGSGSPRREFVFSEDIASAVLFLLSKKTEIDYPLNIGSGVDFSIKELAEIIREVVGFEGSISWDTSKPDGSPKKLLDSSRLRHLGWKPDVELIDGIRKTYAWYLDHITMGVVS